VITEVLITEETKCAQDALCFRQDQSFRDHRRRGGADVTGGTT
jgi:hypothetical protein